MGVLRRQLWLDRLIEHYTDRKVADLDLAVRVILRLGLYQLRFLSRIPARRLSMSRLILCCARLRSADLRQCCLRRATREPEVDPASNILDPIESLAVVTSHPRWLIERWTEAFGAEEAEAFARANNEPAPVAFRVVNIRADEAEVFGNCISRRSVGCFRNCTRRLANNRRHDLFGELAKTGKVYLQDEASQLVAAVVGARAGSGFWTCVPPGQQDESDCRPQR